jgi:hypothetical protein
MRIVALPSPATLPATAEGPAFRWFRGLSKRSTRAGIDAVPTTIDAPDQERLVARGRSRDCTIYLSRDANRDAYHF